MTNNIQTIEEVRAAFLRRLETYEPEVVINLLRLESVEELRLLQPMATSQAPKVAPILDRMLANLARLEQILDECLEDAK